jgi:sialic acid synthase SpsE
MGAVVIEKHFTLDRNLPGPDHKASLEPQELAEMVRSVRQIEKALGSSRKIPGLTEMRNLGVARKSLVAKRAITKGETFTQENITCKRPGIGISPMMYWDVIGKNAPRNFEVDEVLEI